jgi:hypothetical protein
MKHAASRLLTRQGSWDSTRLCWCVRTAAAAIVSKPHGHCHVFVSLTRLDWTRICWCVRTLSMPCKRNFFISFEFSKFDHCLRYCSYNICLKKLSFAYYKISLRIYLINEGPRLSTVQFTQKHKDSFTERDDVALIRGTT